MKFWRLMEGLIWMRFRNIIYYLSIINCTNHYIFTLMLHHIFIYSYKTVLTDIGKKTLTNKLGLKKQAKLTTIFPCHKIQVYYIHYCTLRVCKSWGCVNKWKQKISYCFLFEMSTTTFIHTWYLIHRLK